MSYIAFELDALNVARDVGAAAGIAEERVTHGLLRMWAWCFREKTEHVTATHVRGFFGADCMAALQAFGFLAIAEGFDCAEEAHFRVRGAERYLRVSEARKKGAEKTNAAKRERTASATGATLERRSSDAGATLNRALPDALTPSTEHRAPNTEHQEEKAPAAQEQLRQTWNDHRGPKLPEWRHSKHRDTPARERLKERPLAEWVVVVQRIAASAFCTGANDRGWKADPDWLLRPGTATKVLEGKYDGTARVSLDGDWRGRVDHSQDFFAGVDT